MTKVFTGVTLCGMLLLLVTGGATVVTARQAPVTMAALGQKLVVNGTNGDTWDSAWLANDTVYLQCNDATGFGDGDSRHDILCALTGSPEAPQTLSGVNLNPGTLGKFLGATYSTGLYEVDGVLYHNICYSSQDPNNFRFYHTSIIKSTDGGATWKNYLGQLDTLPPDSLEQCVFADDRFGLVNFVKYGRGGAAPNIDNAREYVYFVAPGYLARIKRTDLRLLGEIAPEAFKAKIQYFKGGKPGWHARCQLVSGYPAGGCGNQSAGKNALYLHRLQFRPQALYHDRLLQQ